MTLGTVLEPSTPRSRSRIDYFRIRPRRTRSSTASIRRSSSATTVEYGSLITRGPVDAGFPGLPGPIIHDRPDQPEPRTRPRSSGFDYRRASGASRALGGRFTVSAATATYFIQASTSQNPDGTFSGERRRHQHGHRRRRAAPGNIRLDRLQDRPLGLQPRADLPEALQRPAGDDPGTRRARSASMSSTTCRRATAASRTWSSRRHPQPVRPGPAVFKRRRPGPVPGRLRPGVRRSARALLLRRAHVQVLLNGAGTMRQHRSDDPDLDARPAAAARRQRSTRAFRAAFYARWGHENALVCGTSR